jgi:hypothetical protein
VLFLSHPALIEVLQWSDRPISITDFIYKNNKVGLILNRGVVREIRTKE